MAGFKRTELKSVKDTCGFEDGASVWIIKGDTFPHKDFLKEHGARFRRDLNWYFSSSWSEVPTEMPDGLELISITWDEVGNADGTFKEESYVKEVVASKVYEKDPSEYQGSIGERLELYVLVEKKAQFEQLGEEKICYTFRDENENAYTWFTNSYSKTSFEEGESVTIRGTVKSFSSYKNCKSTVLNRVMRRG